MSLSRRVSKERARTIIVAVFLLNVISFPFTQGIGIYTLILRLMLLGFLYIALE